MVSLTRRRGAITIQASASSIHHIFPGFCSKLAFNYLQHPILILNPSARKSRISTTMELQHLQYRRHGGQLFSKGDKSLTTGTDLAYPTFPLSSSIAVSNSSEIILSTSDIQIKRYAVDRSYWLNLSLYPISSSPEARKLATYTVLNSTFTPGVPDIAVHLGLDRTSPLVAQARLPHWGANTFGVRNPNGASGGRDNESGANEISWETLQRTSGWTHATYDFCWEQADGERKKYTWRRSKLRVFDDQDDLELVERGREDVVLAGYACGSLLRWRKRGQLWIRDLVLEGELNIEEMRRWELVVIVTGMSLLELARRRARARWHSVVHECYF